MNSNSDAVTDSRKIKIVAMDLDGTALDSRGDLAQIVRHEIRLLRAQGKIVVAATARPLRGLFEVDGIDEVFDYAILCNGSHGRELASGTDVWKDVLGVGYVDRLRVHLDEVAPGVRMICDFDDGQYEPSSSSTTLRFGKSARPLRQELIAPKGPVLRVELVHPTLSADALCSLVRQYRGDLQSVFHSGGRGVEVGPVGASKGSGLAKLAAQLDIKVSEIAAIGDMPNDIPMLQIASFSAAVANAHPSLFELVDMKTLSRGHIGVVEFLRIVRGGP